ncbi:DUF5133 domain-containing protein [Streptomyces sp. UC4497]
MLLPTAADLRRALARHAEAIIEDERHSTPSTARARQDSAYTLCVMTGTNDVADAVRAADALYRRTPAHTTPHPVAATPGPFRIHSEQA